MFTHETTLGKVTAPQGADACRSIQRYKGTALTPQLLSAREVPTDPRLVPRVLMYPNDPLQRFGPHPALFSPLASLTSASPHSSAHWESFASHVIIMRAAVKGLKQADADPREADATVEPPGHWSKGLDGH
jgi:hypothetical protein